MEDFLHFGNKHRSCHISETINDETQHYIRNRYHQKILHAPVNIEESLQLAGLWEFTKLNRYNIDNRLITALCERWRPETHTFLFPSGECTITLEDVHMLLGLKINGEPVTGRTEIPWETIESVLGSAPSKPSRDGLSVKLSWLQKYIKGTGMTGPHKSTFV